MGWCVCLVNLVCILLLTRLCFKYHVSPFVVIREIISGSRPLGYLFGVILCFFVNLYGIATLWGNSRLSYGEFSYFFDVTYQLAELDDSDKVSPSGSQASADAEPTPPGESQAPADAEPTPPKDDKLPPLRFIIACITSIAGKLLVGGIFVAVLVEVVSTVCSHIRHGLVSPWLRSDFVAVLGYRAGMTEALLTKLHQSAGKNTRLILMTNKVVPTLRLTLQAALPEGIWERLKIVHGGWTESDDLRQLTLERCSDIYLLGEEGEDNHDSLSLKALDVIQLLLEKAKPQKTRPVCHVLWEKGEFFNIMLTSDVARYIGVSHPRRLYDVRTYNVHEMLASNVLTAKGWRPGDDTLCPPLDRISFLREPEKRVHFIIIGMSPFGQALLRAAILHAHYPNGEGNADRRTLITVIDAEADLHMERLRNRYPRFFSRVCYECRNAGESEGTVLRFHETDTLLDLEIHFLKGRVESEPVRDFLSSASGVLRDVVTVAVCLSDSDFCLRTAMDLPPELRGSHVPVYVYQQSRENLLAHNINSRRRARWGMVNQEEHEKNLARTGAAYSNLYPVGCIETLFDSLETNVELPTLFHQIYHKTLRQIELRARHDVPTSSAGQGPAAEMPKLVKFARLCYEAQDAPRTRIQTITEAAFSPSDTWAAFFRQYLDMGEIETSAQEEMERNPVVKQWSNRYIAEVQESRRRQFPIPTGVDHETQWKSVLAWLDAFKEMEHQRWMAERLLNEDPVKRPHKSLVPLKKVSKDSQLHDIFLCLATYLIVEKKLG